MPPILFGRLFYTIHTKNNTFRTSFSDVTSSYSYIAVSFTSYHPISSPDTLIIHSPIPRSKAWALAV